MMVDMQSRLVKLVEMMDRAKSSALTNEDKTNVVEWSAEYRIKFKITSCANCWIDQITLLTIHTRKLIRRESK